MLEFFACHTVAAMHFTNQNWTYKIVYCITCLMVCKTGFTNWNAKIALSRASMVVTYYIKLFRTGADRHNGIVISLLFLVAETISKGKSKIYSSEKLTFSKVWFSQRENLKKCSRFEEQNGIRYFRGNVHFGIAVFNFLSSTNPCLRFLLICSAREIKGFYQSSLGN